MIIIFTTFLTLFIHFEFLKNMQFKCIDFLILVSVHLIRQKEVFKF